MNAMPSPSPSPQPRYRVLAGHLLPNRSLAQLRQALEHLSGSTADAWVLGPAEEADVVLLPRGVPMPPVVPPVAPPLARSCSPRSRTNPKRPRNVMPSSYDWPRTF